MIFLFLAKILKKKTILSLNKEKSSLEIQDITFKSSSLKKVFSCIENYIIHTKKESKIQGNPTFNYNDFCKYYSEDKNNQQNTYKDIIFFCSVEEDENQYFYIQI